MSFIASDDRGWEGTSVERRLLSTLPSILGLRRDESLAVGRLRNSVFLEAAPMPPKPAPFLVPGLGRSGSDRRHAIGQLVHSSLQQLAVVRAWRDLGTAGPPWSVLTGNAIWDALVGDRIVDPQDLADRMLSATRIPIDFDEGPNAPWSSWRTEEATPALLARVKGIAPGRTLGRNAFEPWLAGCVLDGTVVVYAYAREDRIAARPMGLLTRGGRQLIVYEIRIADALPDNLLTSAPGRRAIDLVDEPLVIALGGMVAAARRSTSCTTLRIETSWPAVPIMPIEHALALEPHLDQLMALAPLVVDEIESALDDG